MDEKRDAPKKPPAVKDWLYSCLLGKWQAERAYEAEEKTIRTWTQMNTSIYVLERLVVESLQKCNIVSVTVVSNKQDEIERVTIRLEEPYIQGPWEDE